MTSGIHKLSALKVKSVDKPGYYGDGGGLWLNVSKLGAKYWVFRFTVKGRSREMGLGNLNSISLSDARGKALECRKLIIDGIDPIEARKTAKNKTQLLAKTQMKFSECAFEYIEIQKGGWKGEKQFLQWISSLKTYAFPIIGEVAINEIETDHVLEVIQPIWPTKTETASRVRGRIESILDWATVKKLRRGENPARWKGHLDQILPARAKVKKIVHLAALPYSQLGEFMKELRQREGVSARALEFAILTAARSAEVREATWEEIDFINKIWIIPASRMKAGKEHRVPLSDEVIRLLNALPQVANTSHFFPGNKSKGLSDMSLLSVLKRMGREGLTQHGFRSTFRDWAGETTAYPREVIEHALAHQLKDKAEAAYQRGDLLSKRALLMQDWAKYALI